jgi:Putative auto-transporter adhesin, head GIN domain
MKKYLSIAIMLLAGSVLFAQPTIKDENAQARDAKGFHSVKVSHAFDVYLTQSSEEGLAVSASDAKYLDDIKTEVKNGELHIWFDAKNKNRWGNRLKLKAYVSFKSLDKLDASGACDINIIDTWKENELNVELSGASDLKGELQVNKLMVDLNGASDMKVTGSATNTEIKVSGASAFKGLDFEVDYCNASASGASDVKITVNKEISARASGASDVHYKGEGLIRDIHTSGAGSVGRIRS